MLVEARDKLQTIINTHANSELRLRALVLISVLFKFSGSPSLANCQLPCL